MSNAIKIKRVGVIFGTLALLAIFVVLVCLPRTSYAAPLGSEKPNIYCTYVDSNGEKCDGDKLAAGTYDVNFYLEGVSELSVMQLTATYSSDVTVNGDAKALLSENVTGVSSMGTVTDNSNLVFGFASDSDTCSAIDSKATLLATFSVTFANDCDAANAITVSTNPNKTFLLTNYEDGLNNEYALVTEFEGYNGSLYLMTCDVSPSTGHSVTGSLVIMTNGKGETANTPVYGEYTVNVYSDEARSDLVGTVTSSLKGDVNSFSVDSLKDGTYYLSISSTYAITRADITLTVNGADIANAVIPMMACDFNSDGQITGTDAVSVYSNAVAGTDQYFDTNGDGIVTGTDAVVVYACSSSSNYYNGLEIK